MNWYSLDRLQAYVRFPLPNCAAESWASAIANDVSVLAIDSDGVVEEFRSVGRRFWQNDALDDEAASFPDARWRPVGFWVR